MNFGGLHKEPKSDAFALHEIILVRVGGHFFFGAAIDHRDTFSAEATREVAQSMAVLPAPITITLRPTRSCEGSSLLRSMYSRPSSTYSSPGISRARVWPRQIAMKTA